MVEETETAPGWIRERFLLFESLVFCVSQAWMVPPPSALMFWPVIQLAEPAGNGKILVKWTAPENNGSTVILGYEVEAAGKSDSSIVGIDGTEECTMSCTVEGLTNGDTYQVTVRAINAKGSGEATQATMYLPIVPMKLLVGTVTVTEENMADILGDGTAFYDGVTNTLTLKNADINVTTGSNAGIKTYGDLNLVLEGENTVSCASYYGINSNSPLTITGGGSLDVQGTDFGIYTSGYDVAELTIGGSAQVTAQSGDVKSGSSYGIHAYDGGIVITGGRVSGQGGQAYTRSCGIQTSGSAQISDAEVTACGGDADMRFGLWTFGDIAVSRSLGQRTNLTTDAVQFAGERSLEGVQMIQPENYTVDQEGG